MNEIDIESWWQVAAVHPANTQAALVPLLHQVPTVITRDSIDELVALRLVQ